MDLTQVFGAIAAMVLIAAVYAVAEQFFDELEGRLNR